MSAENKYLPYAQETAKCVDLAYVAMEEDLLDEMRLSAGETRVVLGRILDRLRERRAALRCFDDLAGVLR